MRKYVILKKPIENTFKLMIYTYKGGCYLYLYNTIDDTHSNNDLYFDNILEAEDYCLNKFGINNNYWIAINSHLEGCQHDLIRNIRIKGSNINRLEYGKYEELFNNERREIIL